MRRNCFSFDKKLNKVALTIEPCAEVGFPTTIGVRRDIGHRAPFPQECPDAISNVGFSGQNDRVLADVVQLGVSDLTVSSGGPAQAVADHRSRASREPRLRLDPPLGVSTERDEWLVDRIARAFAARDQLMAMSEADVAAIPETSLRHIEPPARLSYLAPGIVQSILDGTQPRKLIARHLARIASLPQAWGEQRAALGFAAP